MKIVHEVLFFMSAVAFASVMFFCTGCALTDSNFELKEDSTVKELNEKLANLEKENSDLAKENKNLLEKIEYLTSQKKYYEDALVTLKEEYSYYMSIYTVGDAELADIIAKYEELIKEYTTKIDNLESKVSDYEKQIMTLNKIIAIRDATIISLNDELRTARLEIVKYKELLEKSEGDNIEVINGYKKQIESLNNKIKNLELELTIKNGTIKELTEAINKLTVEYKELLEKNSSNEELIRKYENKINELTIQINNLNKINEELNNKVNNSKTIIIKGKMNGDYRNWVIDGKVNINNVDLKNGTICHNGYTFVFEE